MVISNNGYIQIKLKIISFVETIPGSAIRKRKRVFDLCVTGSSSRPRVESPLTILHGLVNSESLKFINHSAHGLTSGVKFLTSGFESVVIKNDDIFVTDELIGNVFFKELNLPIPNFDFSHSDYIPGFSSLRVVSLKKKRVVLLTEECGLGVGDQFFIFEHIVGDDFLGIRESQIKKYFMDEDVFSNIGLSAMFDLGRIFAGDLLLANFDRIPFPNSLILALKLSIGHKCEGNASNIFINTEGKVFAIDQVVHEGLYDESLVEDYAAALKELIDEMKIAKENPLVDIKEISNYGQLISRLNLFIGVKGLEIDDCVEQCFLNGFFYELELVKRLDINQLFKMMKEQYVYQYKKEPKCFEKLRMSLLTNQAQIKCC
jgi:hypothetical protein